MRIDNPEAFKFFIHEDLYSLKSERASIVEQPAEQETETTIPPINFKYSGQNKHCFLIVVDYKGMELMDEKHLTALQSTLKRKELTMDDIALVNIDKQFYTPENLMDFFKPLRILILGESCINGSWANLPLNQLQHFRAAKVLYTYSFTEMMGDKEKTKAFWEQMKVL